MSTFFIANLLPNVVVKTFYKWVNKIISEGMEKVNVCVFLSHTVVNIPSMMANQIQKIMNM